MAGALAELKKLFKPVLKQENTISGLATVVAVTLLNQLLTTTYFKCPNDGYHRFSVVFLVIPGIIFAFLTLLASPRVEKAVSLRKKARGHQKGFLCRTISLTLAYAVLAFLAWITATLLFTETYVCMQLGPSPDTKNATETKMYDRKKLNVNAESRLIGLWLMFVAMAFTLLVYFFVKCRAEPSELNYAKLEADAAKEAFKDLVVEASKSNVKDLAKKLSGDETNENVEGTTKKVQVDVIEKLRNILIDKYPRLKNPLDELLPYKKPEATTSSSDVEGGERAGLI